MRCAVNTASIELIAISTAHLLDSQLLAEVYLRMLESKNSLLGELEESEDIYEQAAISFKLQTEKTAARHPRYG